MAQRQICARNSDLHRLSVVLFRYQEHPLWNLLTFTHIIRGHWCGYVAHWHARGVAGVDDVMERSESPYM